LVHVAVNLIIGATKSGELIGEGCGDENSVGMTKFYRTQCFKQIDGFVRQVMWDGIDGHRCRMLGWIACSWDESELRFIHLRPMDSSQKGFFTGRMRHGFGQYFMGTSLLYMTVASIYRMFYRPFFVGGLAMWWGYILSMLRCDWRFDDLSFIRFLVVSFSYMGKLLKFRLIYLRSFYLCTRAIVKNSVCR